jgi:hypothetical protein
LNGYRDTNNKKFQFDKHPDGYLWDVEGNLVTNLWGHAPASLCTTLVILGIRMKGKMEERSNRFFT